MAAIVIFDDGVHKNVLLEDYSEGTAVQANQHLIIDGKSAMILDPGGHKVYSKVLAETLTRIGPGGKLDHVFLSHQDPDIVAAVNGWLMTTDAIAHVSKLWVRFVPHFGLDRLVVDRLKGIADEGMWLKVGETELAILPAHFLHSCGNFQVYDPRARILYSGDLGASVDVPYREVPDFDAHIPKMEGFHKRYMASSAALRAWAEMVRGLDIDVIAPQHGAMFRGKEMVTRFIDWMASLEVGIDVMKDIYKVPPR
jgi:flavorubredoxin